MSKQVQDGICEDCAFYRIVLRQKGEVRAQCRRYAPRASPGWNQWRWPEVQADDWCGEFVKDGV